MRHKFPRNLMVGVLITLSAIFLGTRTHAEEYVWDGEALDNLWSSSLNWNPDGLPVSASDTILSFYGSSHTNINDLAGPFQLNRLNIFSSGAAESLIRVTGNQLQFLGANARIYSNRNATEHIDNAIDLASGTILTFEVTTYAVWLNGVVSGDGKIVKLAHAGGLSLTNPNNSFSGGILYNGFTGGTSWNHLIVTASGAMGTGLVELNGGATAAWNGTIGHQPGGLIFRGMDNVHDNHIKLLNDSPIFSELANAASNATHVVLKGDIDGQGYALYLRGGGTGIIEGNYTSSAGGIHKLESNTWTLAGTNTYSGATTIQKTAQPVANPSNNLRSILNVTGTIDGTSSVTVEDGASLAGTGLVKTANSSGQILIKSGGRLAAGDALTGTVGTLNLAGTLAFETGSQWELQFAAASINSVNLTGTVGTLDNVSLVAG